MQNPATRSQNIRLAEISPQTLLAGEAPRLIAEWQLAPQLWDAVRFEVDTRGSTGQFVLTGSAVPADLPEDSHTGTGRIGRMHMRTMSSLESGDSSGAVSLGSLFSGEPMPVAPSDKQLDDVAFLVCRGGWPQSIGMTERQALRQARDYLDVDRIRRSGQYTDECLLELAERADPGFDRKWFAHRLSTVDRLQQREVEPYGVTPQQLEDIKTRCRSWGKHLHEH